MRWPPVLATHMDEGVDNGAADSPGQKPGDVSAYAFGKERYLMEAKSPKTSRLVKLQKVQAGLAKHFQPASTLQVGGTSYTAQDLTVLIQGDLDAMKASAKAHADWRSLVQVERSSHDKVTPVLQLLEGLIVNMFGDTQQAMSILEDFGFKPRKRTKRTVAKQSTAAAKTLGTRKARHTMGPKQKAEIHGDPVTPPTPKA